ncbi:MAG: hypothetical protein IJP48_04430 [Synergistaceae bacterium]|nr:hypothetical protein [Synergistaceae bacterium]
MKNYLSEHVLKNLLITAGIIITGYLLLVLVYCIPDNLLDKNVRISAEKLYKEGVYPDIYASGSFLDNFTDGACIAITINRKNDNPFYSAIDSYQSGSGKDGLTKFYQTVFESETITPKLHFSHSYMWDGFRIYLRPLLIRYPIQDIRVLCAWLVYALSFILCILILDHYKNFFAIIPFMCAFLFFNFQLEALSLLFFNDIFFMLLGSLLVIRFIKRGNNYYLDELFAAVGALVGFTSMLITPMLSVGFMLVCYLIFRNNNHDLKHDIYSIIKYSASWLTGYAVTTFTKVFLSSAFGLTLAGKGQVQHYSGGSLYNRLAMNYRVFMRLLITSRFKRDFMIITVLIFLAVLIYRKAYTRWKDSLPYLFIASYPVVWVFVMAGHSGHGWTYFNYSISIFAVLQVMFIMILQAGEKK